MSRKDTDIHKETVGDLNAKILEITMRIKEKYPELSKYLDEMKVSIPDEKNPEVNVKSLQKYHDSLRSMLNRYMLGRPESPPLKHGM